MTYERIVRRIPRGTERYGRACRADVVYRRRHHAMSLFHAEAYNSERWKPDGHLLRAQIRVIAAAEDKFLVSLGHVEQLNAVAQQ